MTTATASTDPIYLPEGLGTVIDGPVRVEFDYIGEGISGDYDDSDPDDVALLRLDVNVRTDSGYAGEQTTDPDWLYPSDGSICTQVEYEADEATRKAALLYAAAALRSAVQSNGSVKHTMDRLSYLPHVIV